MIRLSERDARGLGFLGRPCVDARDAEPLHASLVPPIFLCDEDLAELERRFYQHVLCAIDFDALFRIEQQLYCELSMRDELGQDRAIDLMNAIVARSLERVVHDQVRAVKRGTIGPTGAFVEPFQEPDEGCPFCNLVIAPVASGEVAGAARPQELAS